MSEVQDQFLDAMQEANEDVAAGKAAAFLFNAMAEAEAINEAVNATEFGEVPADRQFFSIGRICEMVGQSPVAIRAAAKSAGVTPQFSLNDIGYYAGDAVLKIRHQLMGALHAE